MKEKFNKKKLLLIVAIMLGILLLGGTFAVIIADMTITNGNISGTVECFDIDYSIENDTGAIDSRQITGTLFPSKNHMGGLFGKVRLGVNSNCSVTGTGTLYLHINEGTSNELVKTVTDHCENASLETINGDSSTNCTENWISDGTALKYAIYDNVDGTGDALSVGYIKESDIGNDITIYSDFLVNNLANDYYIFIWMDGYLIDNTYSKLPFGGYIHASVLQNE